MDLKFLFQKHQTDGVGKRDPDDQFFNWIIYIATTFTVFAFWGWLAYVLVEHAQREGIATSTVYLLIFAISFALLIFAYFFYHKMKRAIIPSTQTDSPPNIKLKEKQK